MAGHQVLQVSGKAFPGRVSRAAAVRDPLAGISVLDLTRVRQLEDRFLSRPPDRNCRLEVLAGRALLSAILFGGLLAPHHWQPWLDAMLKVRRAPLYMERFYHTDSVEGGKGDRRQRNWCPDPHTGPILRKLTAASERVIRDGGQLPVLSARKCLKAAIARLERPGSATERHGGSSGHTDFAKNPETLARACLAWLHIRIPGLLADHAAGLTGSHVVRDRPRNTESPPVDEGIPELTQFIRSAWRIGNWDPWFRDRSLLRLREHFFPGETSVTPSPESILREIKNQQEWWSKHRHPDALHSHFLVRLHDQVSAAKEGKKRKQKLMAARTELVLLASVSWDGIRSMRLAKPECKAAIVAKLDELIQKAAGRSLTYYHRARGLATSLATQFDIEYELPSLPSSRPKGPRAQVLTPTDFRALLGMLREWGAVRECGSSKETIACSNRDECPTCQAHIRRADACQLAAVLMFRTGLRGKEAAGLAINDIQFERRNDIQCERPLAELVVRGNAERSNKNRYGRRTLPLDVLLEPVELERVRQWWSARRDVTMHREPRARLFPVPKASQLTSDQYLLEPIDAAIRLIFGETLHNRDTRRQRGYWYSLASPLRHSFASYLVTTLLLPDDRLNLPHPPGTTGDLVSTKRKRAVTARMLPKGHSGLAAMQVVRYLMGHATHTTAIRTYVHVLDWLLAAHLWRDAMQRPVTEDELRWMRPQTVKTGPDNWTAVDVRGERQLRRYRRQLAKSAYGRAVTPKPARGRPKKGEGGGRQMAGRRIHYLLDHALPVEFFKRSELSKLGQPDKGDKAGKADRKTLSAKHPVDGYQPGQRVDYGHQLAAPGRGWQPIYIAWRAHTRGVSTSIIAERIAVPVEECALWIERLQTLANAMTTSGKPRLPFLMSAKDDDELGRLHISDGREELLDRMWARRDALSRKRVWAETVLLMSRWQLAPRSVRTWGQIERTADLYRRLGVPGERLVWQVDGLNWGWLAERNGPPLPPSSQFRLSVSMTPDNPNAHIHGTIGRGIVAMIVASKTSLDRLVEASQVSRNRPPPAPHVQSRRRPGQARGHPDGAPDPV